MLLTEETKVINHKEVIANTLVSEAILEETNNYDMKNYRDNYYKNIKESQIIREKIDEK